jgi:hypothetical protein
MEALCASETLASAYKYTWRYNLEDQHQHISNIPRKMDKKQYNIYIINNCHKPLENNLQIANILCSLFKTYGYTYFYNVVQEKFVTEKSRTPCNIDPCDDVKHNDILQ